MSGLSAPTSLPFPVPAPTPPSPPPPALPVPVPAPPPTPALKALVAESPILSVITFGLKLHVPPPAEHVKVCGRESEGEFTASHLTPFEFSEQFPTVAAGNAPQADDAVETLAVELLQFHQSE